MKKIVLAKLTVSQESIAAFKQLIAEIVPNAQKEEGCISYNVYENSIQQTPEFVFWEEYKDEEALQAHNASEHFKKFFAGAAPLFTCEPEIIVK